MRKSLLLAIVCLISFASNTIFAADNVGSKITPKDKETMIGGWYQWDPYQHIETNGDVSKLTGLDIELEKAIAKIVGKKLEIKEVSWKQHQLDLKSGVRDIASGATYTKARSEFVYFSDPYRYEENSLFVPRSKMDNYNFSNVDEMLKYFKDKKIKVAVIDGYIYADPKINEFVANPENQRFVFKTESDVKSLELLTDNKVDAFLADRLVGATIIWRANLGKEVAEIKLHIKTPIHLMFSKASVPIYVVKEFNKAIKEMKESNEYNKIVTWYLYPVLLLQTISSEWFFVIDLLGTFAFAISGLIIAYKERSTLFGAFIFAVLPAIGGGLMRDVIVGRNPAGAMQSPLYMSIVFETVIIGYLFLKVKNAFFSKNTITLTADQTEIVNTNGNGQNNNGNDLEKTPINALLIATDALGLAAFAVSGVVITIWAKATPLWLWGPFFAFLTGAGGGILRDILRKDRVIVSLRGDLYPEFAAIAGFGLSLFLTLNSNDLSPEPLKYAVIATVAGAFAFRMLAYFFNVKNIMFR